MTPIPGTGGGGDKDVQRRLRSNMLIMNSGGVTTSEAETNAMSALDQGDPNKAFTTNVLRATKAEKVTATRMNNLGITIAQGKIIDAVVETALNTDLPGTIRAIVARDVYAETGRGVMIPKGSRLLGTYNTNVTRGQKRVLIIWTRILRPDGLDIMIGSPGVDALGRAGVQGLVDNKYTEMFSAAILTSLLTIGVAAGAEAVTDGGTTTNNTDGSTTRSGGAGIAAGAEAVRTIGDVSKQVVRGVIDQRPTITLDQGTRINVFVNKDLTFPASVLDSHFVQ